MIPKRHRLAYVVSHPIQYQAPLLRRISESAEVDLKVFFVSDFSLRPYRDPGFGNVVDWDIDLVRGYPYEVLPAIRAHAHPTALTPWPVGMRRRLTTENFDALWVHGYATNATLRALLTARRAGLRTLIRGESSLALAGKPSGLRRAALRRLLGQVDAALAIGTRNAEFYLAHGIGHDRIFPMPYAVDNAFFRDGATRAQPERSRLKRELNVNPDSPVVLFASKLQERKRPRDVLDGFQRVELQSGLPPVLLFVGDGDQRPELEQTASRAGIADRVRFLGFRNQTELPAFYDLCDVFVLVSEGEPWGLAVNEVMNAGKPVIVSDQVGCGDDLVRDGWNGYVVPVGDPVRLGQRLEGLLQDSDLARAMGQRSAEIIDRCSYDQDLDGLVDALEYCRHLRHGR